MPTWLTIVLALGGSAFISGVIGYLVKRSLDKLFARKEQEEQQREDDRKELEALKEEKLRAERKADIEEIVIKHIEPLNAEMKEINYQIKLNSEANLSALRNDILTCYYKCVEKGYRNDYDYTNIHDLDKAYVGLDGNSFVEDIMKRFDALPVKEETVPVKVVVRKTKKEVTETKSK